MSRDGRSLRGALLALVSTLAYRTGLLRVVALLVNRFEAVVNGEGRLRFPYVRARRSGNVQILLYHRVVERPDEFMPALPLDHFSRQMEYLARHCRVLPLAEAVEALERCRVPDDVVVISFDDGYRDNFDHAFPVLRSLSLPATVFLTTGVIGASGILWHDRVCRAFASTDLRSYRGRALDSQEAREAARGGELAELRRLDGAEREARIDRLVAELRVDERASAPRLMLTWQEAEEMARHGISFGAHTVTHPILSRIPLEAARTEIEVSKREIERRLGGRVDAFAYPNGRRQDYTAETKRLVREAGYRCAVTTRFGTNRPADDGGWDPLELFRGGPTDGETALFAAKLRLYKFAT